MQPNIEKLQKLLDEVGKIREKHENIARLKGEGFNVFGILGLDENKHSDFIAELLSPQGSHAQAGKFLDLFLDILVEAKIIDNKLAYQNAEVQREVTLSENSRLDILLSANSGTIYIENKIWASDQTEQVKRYHDAGKNKPNFKLLYLTPSGKEAESAGNLKAGEHYFPISYQTHIIKWLEACHKETADLPILRETIKQYIIYLKKHITGQAQNNEMEKELNKVILDNIAEAALLTKQTNNALRALLEEVMTKLKEKLNNLNGKLEISIADVSKLQIVFSNNWQKNFAIAFVWQGQGTIQKPIFHLGVVAEPKKFDNQKVIEFFKEKLTSYEKKLKFPSEKNTWWLWAEDIQYEKLQNISSDESIIYIANAIKEYTPLCDEIDKNFRKTA